MSPGKVRTVKPIADTVDSDDEEDAEDEYAEEDEEPPFDEDAEAEEEEADREDGREDEDVDEDANSRRIDEDQVDQDDRARTRWTKSNTKEATKTGRMSTGRIKKIERRQYPGLREGDGRPKVRSERSLVTSTATSPFFLVLQPDCT